MIQLIKILYKIKSILKRKIHTYIVQSQCASCGTDLRVHNKTFVTKKTIIGNNANFNGMKITGDGVVSIGNNFHSGEDCLMISQIHNYDKGCKIPYDNTYICKDIVIEDQVWLGSRVIVLAGVTIGEGAIIQAGSVVVKDIPMHAIAGGHPCETFKYRDIEHYEQLKANKQFH